MGSITGGPVPEFHLRWRGYDRDEVDRFIRESADRQRRRNGTSNPDPLSPNRQNERAEEVVMLARRHAHEIRMTAEQEADRMLREAERQAAFLASERHDSHRRELDRLAAVRRDLEGCLESAVSALERVRDVSAQANPSADSPSTEPALPAASGPSNTQAAAPQASPDRFRRLHWVAFFMCGLFLMSIVLMVSMPPDDGPVTASSPAVTDSAPDQGASDEAVNAAPLDAVSTAQRSDLAITIVASEECWISVATDDKAPRERLLKPSEKIVVQAQDAVTLTAGNAGALSIMINDQPATPLGFEKRVVTRRITRANYREFLAPPTSAGTN
jgi:hypothetical protein